MSEKARDRHGRWRATTVSFRASDYEINQINEAVALSGLTKQEYIITKLINRDVVVYGNPRVFKALRNKMDAIYGELKRITTTGEVSEQLMETITLVATIYAGMTKEKENE